MKIFVFYITAILEDSHAVEEFPINVTVAENEVAILPCRVERYDDQMVCKLNDLCNKLTNILYNDNILFLPLGFSLGIFIRCGDTTTFDTICRGHQEVLDITRSLVNVWTSNEIFSCKCWSEAKKTAKIKCNESAFVDKSGETLDINRHKSKVDVSYNETVSTKLSTLMPFYCL